MPSLRDYLPGTGTAPASLDSLVPGQGLVAAPPPMPMGPDLTQHNDLTEAAGMTEVGKGFRSGRLGSDANYLASQEFSLRAAGRHDEADAIRNQIGIIQQRAGVFAPRVQKVEDAWANPTDAPAWLGGVVGQVGSSMVDSVATGVGASKAAQLIGLLPHPVAKAIGRAGSWIGAGAAAVPNVLNARGETANQMVEDPTLMANTTAEQRNDAAWLSGGAQGLVDTAMPSVIINRLGGAGIAKGVHKLPLVPRIAADMVGEGTQEVVQEGMKKGTLSYLNPNRDTSGDASDYLNSFASGLGMAPHAAASIAVDNGFRRLGVKGDGERGDDIDLSGKDITTQLAAAAKGGKGRSLADSIAYSELLHGTEATPDVTDQSGLTRRRDALLSELAKYPNAAALAQPLTEMNDRLSLMRGVDAMDEAADFLAPKLGLTTEQLAKKGGKPKNSLQVDPKDFGKGQIDTSEMPARTPEQQAAVVEAERQHKTQTARLRSLLENTYTQQHADAGSTFNPSIKKLLGSYAPELAAIMSPGVAEKPTAGEIARAKRIGSSIGSALGEKANGALVAVAQRLGVKNSPVFDAMHDEAVKVAEHRKSGGHAVHAQHMTERDAAAQALLDAAPEFDARMAKQGVDLRLEDNAHLREQLLSHMEDHADGEGVATQAQLEEQFGKEAYAKMMEIVGGPIAPRHTAAPKATEQKASPKPKLSSDDITDGETSDYEKRGHEKSHTAVDPGSLVFGHSQTEARSAADAFKPGADGKLMKLIPADRMDSDGRRSLSVMQLRMAQALRSQSKGYVYGRQKDGKVGTSAKELMDRQGVHGDQRVALMGQYLAQENPGADHTDFVETVKALPALRRVDELMSAAVQSGPLTSPEASRTLRGQLKRVMNYVANPEQFLSTDIPLSAPARAAQNLAIVKAVHKAHADIRGMIDGHESLAPMVADFKATHGRAPSTHELADHFFGNRFLVHAEKLSDRDYLKIDNDEFTKLHREGTKLLRAAEHQAHESGGNVDEHKAGMNLIHFRSLAAAGQKKVAAGDRTIAIPAHKLVAWVRDMRNKHTGDTRTGDNTQSYSDNEKADQYLGDLKEGINALMAQKLVRGTPWIVNAAGGKEMFSRNPEMGPPDMRAGLPSSLSVGDGRTFAEMKEARGTRADEKLEEEIATRQAKPLGLKSMGEAVADHNAMHERDAEIGQDEADMQDADHVRESEEMMNGSKRDRAEREHLWKMAQVVLAAADRPPAVLNKLTAFTKAKYVADRLWRDYIGDKYADPDGKLYVDPNARKPTHAQQVEAHAKAVGAILSYVTATEKTAFDPSDKDKTYRGDHFIAPLAALLTPNHMAAIAEHYPNELEKVKLLQAKVASVLLHMAYGAEKATITPGQLKQAVDSLTGYADAAHDLKMAQAQLARADGAAEKQSAQAAVTAAKSASPVQQPAYKQLLTDMALPYFEVARRRGYAARSADKARNEAVKNPGRERHFITPFAEMVFGEAPVESAPGVQFDRLGDYDLADHHSAMVSVYGMGGTLGASIASDPPRASARVVAGDPRPTGTQHVTSSIPATPGKSQAKKVSIDTTPKPRAISRKPKADPNITVGELRQAQAERPTPAGDYRKTSVDLYSEVAADTAAAEQGVDNVAALAGALAQSARSQKAEGVVAKRENNATIADAAAKLNAGATIQQVNAGIAAKRDEGETGLSAEQAQAEINRLQAAGKLDLDAIVAVISRSAMSPEERATVNAEVDQVRELTSGVLNTGGLVQKTVDSWSEKYAGGAKVTVATVPRGHALESFVSRLVEGATAESVGGMYMQFDGGHYILSFASGMRGKATSLSRLAHEFGHALEVIAFKGAPLNVTDKLVASYEADLVALKTSPAEITRFVSSARLFDDATALAVNNFPAADSRRVRASIAEATGEAAASGGLPGGITTFSEWFAENFSKFVTSDLATTLDPEVKSFWTGLMAKMKEFFNNYVSQYKPDASFKSWVESLAAQRAAPNTVPKTVNIWHGSGENAALSNLADRPLQFNSRMYVSVEHAYQSNKSGKFDQATYDKYKVAGRKIPGTMGTKTEGGWNLKLMKRLISESFKSNPDAMEKLLATGDAKLTHTQDRGVWAAEFPRILTEVRSEAAAGDTGLIAVKAPAAPTSKTPVFDALPSHKPGQKTMTYAGIGSRRTTPDVLRKMTAAAKQLAAMGYTLQSGGAQGADSAFEQGAEGKAQVFKASDATDQTRKIAKEIHPNPGALGIFPLNLMARNTNQVFGADLKTPVDFVLTWTPDGAESTAERSIATGGTGQAIDMASRKGIPVINMAKPDWQARVRAIVRAGSKVVVLPLGTSGSGKSTWVKSLPKDNLVVISPDEMRVEFTGDVNDKSRDGDIYKEVATRTISAINGGKRVVIDSTNLQKERRRAFINTVRSAVPDANIQFKLMPLDPALAKQRIAADIAAGVARANVPDSTIDRHAALYGQMLEDIKHEGMTAFTEASTTTLTEAIAQRLEFLNNPPADYTTEKAQAIKAWAARQQTRVQDEIEKTEKNVRFGVGKVGEYDDRLTELYDRRLDLKLLDQKTDDVLEGDASLKGFEGDAVKNSLQTADTARTLTPEEIKTFDKNKLGSAAPVSKDNEIVSTRIALRRMLGDKIKTLFEESFPDMQGGADWNETKAIIRIATASSVPMMQRGYHEAMHAFYSLILKNSPEAQAMIERVTSDPKIIERMAAMLKDSPDAVEQMRTDAEERAAYAYQFWAAGMLDIGKKPETFFEKVQAFMRRVLGAVRENDKAMAIFTAFHDGKLTEPSAAGLAITKVMETGEWRAKMLKRFDKQAQAAYSEVMAAINVGMNSESPTARTIAMMFYSHPSVAKTAGKPGYIDSAQLARHQYENLIQAALRPLMGDNLERDMAELAQVLNGKAKAVQPHVEKAARDIYAALHRFHKYAREAGVDIGVRDDGTYFPRVIQLETMIEKKAEFIDMLVTNYPSAMAQIGKSLAAQGKPAAPEDAAALIHQSYIDRGGIENAALSVMREDGVLNPFFASQNERKLHWIRDEHIAPFLSTDVVSTLTRYFSQGTRSAEYVRRFGEDGQKLKDMMARLGDVRFISKTGQVENYTEDGPVVKELKAAAVKAKAAKPDEWVDRRMEDLQRSFGAMEGSLGKDISAGYRQFQGNIMTYQVLRTLPLSLFSAMLDPNGLRVAGGTSENMWYAYRRGLLGVFNTWKDLVKGNPLGIKDPDKYEAAANAMGVIAPTMYLEQYGGVHSSEYSAGAARKINHKFFLANGLTSWDRDMRIAATKAAMESIVSNEANTIPAHSARWLKELGLAQNDGVVRTDADGELVTNKHVLAQMRADEKGTTKDEEMAQAEKDAHKIAVAVNRWVARAIMAPNAALRPSRASDPHYAMFFQLKSFTYAFTETTLKYAMAEAEEGNLNAGAQLMRGVPIMIAADMIKALLTNGGSLPGYMANWTMADWVLHGINRSGNLGTPQLGLDALHGAHGSIMGAVGTVGGPTVSQGIDLAAGALNGNLGTEVGKSIPFFNKIGQAAHSVGGMLDMGE